MTTWVKPEPQTEKKNANGFNPQGWQDELLNGPIPTDRRNQEMQRLIGRWRTRCSETECRLLAYAQGEKWKYDQSEYDKLDRQITTAYNADAVYEFPEGPENTDPRTRLRAFVSRLTDPKKRDRTMSTGLTVLDIALGGDTAQNIMGGFDPGSLVYIPAEKGTGKSIFTNNDTVFTLKQKRGVLYLCPEMSYDDQMARIFAAVMGRPTKMVRNNMMGRQPVTEIDIRAYEHAEALITSWPLIVRDDTFTLQSIVEAVEAWPADGAPLEKLVVDSPHVLLPPPGHQPGRGALEANSLRLLALTKKHKLVTLAPCQIARPEGRAKEAANWRPTRWSLRDSEALGHHADVLLLLYREKKSRVLEISIAKGRNGEGEDEAEWLSVEFEGMYSRLGNLKAGHHA